MQMFLFNHQFIDPEHYFIREKQNNWIKHNSYSIIEIDLGIIKSYALRNMERGIISTEHFSACMM